MEEETAAAIDNMENQEKSHDEDDRTSNNGEANTPLADTDATNTNIKDSGNSAMEVDGENIIDSKAPESNQENADACEENPHDTANRDRKQDTGDDDGTGREYKTRRSIRRTSTDEPICRKRLGSSVSGDEAPKKKVVRNNSVSLKQEGGQPKPQQGFVDENHDKYCWVCHREGVTYHCKICPRSFHPKCISVSDVSETSKVEGDSVAKVCVCPECTLVMKAENIETRSEAMKLLSPEELQALLQHICDRLRTAPGSEPFLNPVSSEDAEDYYDFIVYPMDVHTLEKNLREGQYGSTEAFMSDAQWIVHNSIIFNSVSSVYTQAAKRLLKVCRQELTEIETCPECYRNAHELTKPWFVEACARPHILVWAKLKGFPYWPAKAMKIKDDQVDVRFFGEHDRAWVKLADCLLYMVEQPFVTQKKPNLLNAALDELNQHVEKLKERFGEVTFVTEKTQIGPNLSVEQIQRLLPQYKAPTIVAKEAESKSASLEAKYQQRSISDRDSASKSSENPASDSEANDDPKQDESAEPESDPKVPDGEILANALGLTRINKSEPLRKSTRLSANENSLLVKIEPNDSEGTISQELDETKRGTKAKNLMEQISNQTQAKPGYRFNISKDISISAIDNDDESDMAEMKMANQMPKGVAANQPKGTTGGQTRYVVGKDGQLRPLIKTGPGGVMKPPSRTPMQTALQPQMRKAKDGSYQPIVGDGNAKAVSRQPQGAVTLPGGSITVTPLADSGRGGQMARGANGLPMNGNNGKFGKALRAQQQITRNFGPSSSSALPPSARILLQDCLKACEEQISNTITIAMASLQPGPGSGKDSADGEKEQVQKLQQRIQRYEKEIADMKHGHSLLVKELKAGYDKRMADVKRMHEQEKLRQATELKKKQWCASCGREAMFYCCWNTSYCGYECQEEHWPTHMTSCSQGQNRNQINNNQLQLQNGGR